MNIRRITSTPARANAIRTNFKEKSGTNFKGAEKVAGQATGAAGKAFSSASSVAGAAGKAGTGQTNPKFLQTAFETVKYIGEKVFRGIAQIIDEISNLIKGSKKTAGAGFEAPKAADKAPGSTAGKNIASDTTEAAIHATEQAIQGATARESAQEAAQEAAEQGTKVIPFPKKAEDAIEVLVGGQKYMFRPGKDKLPEGATIKDGVLMLDKETRKEAPMAAMQKIREAIELAKSWGMDEPEI